MALVQCKECKTDISSSAKVCPKCGAKNKRKSIIIRVFVILIVISLMKAIITNSNSNISTNPSPESLAKDQHEKKMQDLRIRIRHAEETLRQEMRNPESFKVSTITWNFKTDSVCFQYRSQNGFGGMNVSYALWPGASDVILDEHAPGFSSKWKKECLSEDTKTVGDVKFLM